jgi:hypothetical protein
VEIVPVGVSDCGEEPCGLFLTNTPGRFDPGPEWVPTNHALEVEGGVVFGFGEGVNERGEAGYVGVVEGEPEPAFPAVFVGFVAGELPQPVLVRDPDPFEVVENVSGEG